MKQCSNKAECDNGIPLKVSNQTDPSMEKNWDNEYDEVMNALGELPLTEAVQATFASGEYGESKSYFTVQ